MNLEKTFNNLPGWSKGAIAIFIIAGVGVVGWQIYLWNEKRKKSAEIDTAKDEADKLNKDPKTKGTLSPAQLAIYADTLHAAMDGYQTDESSIYKVFANIKNDADVLGLIKAYGIRKLSSGSYSLEKDYEGALGGSLSGELDSKEMIALNTSLAKKGIKYRF